MPINIHQISNRHMTIKSNQILLYCILFAVFFLACKEGKDNNRIVSVSILPQKYFTERIAGDCLQVNVMIPPGMNPATCDLSTGQLKKLYDSDLYFAIGHLPFEVTHLYPVLKEHPDIQLINHSTDVSMLAGCCNHAHSHDSQHQENVDPHIWLSPHIAQQMIDTIYQVLSKKYPEYRTNFSANYAQLSAEIDTIAHKAEEILSQKQGHVFLIYHPALTYLASEYHIEQISIENEGKEPNPSHLKSIIDLAKKKNVRIVFIQNQFDENNARSIAKEIDGEVIPINPLAENWTKEMHRLLDLLKEKL